MRMILTVSWLKLVIQRPAVLGFSSRVQPARFWSSQRLGSAKAEPFLSSTQPRLDVGVNTVSSLPADPSIWSQEDVIQARSDLWVHLNKSRARNATESALELLEGLLDQETLQTKSSDSDQESHQDDGNSSSEPIAVGKGLIFNVLKKCSRVRVSSEESLDRLERLVNKLHITKSYWDPKILQFVLRSLCNCGKNGQQRAEALLDKFIETQDARPNKHHFNTVLYGYGNLGMAKQALDLLTKMENMQAATNEDLITAAACNSVIKALANSGQRNAPQEAESIVKKMEENPDCQPDIATYTSLLNCFAKFGMAERAERYLEELEQMHIDGVLDQGPNTITFVVLIDAWSNSRARDAHERAEAVFDFMLELIAAGRQNMEPQVAATAMMACFAKLRRLDAAYKFLRKLHELHEAGRLDEGPITKDYNSLLNVIAKSGAKDAAGRAQEIVLFMHELQRKGLHPQAAPDANTYSLLIHCYAQEGMGQEAVDVLMQMHDLYNAGELDKGPDTVCYSCVLNALSRSDNPEAPELAKKIMYRMQLFAASHRELLPNVITYNTFLNVLLKARDFEEAFECIEEMTKTHQRGDLPDGPDTSTFRMTIQGLADTAEPDRLVEAEKLLDHLVKMHAAGRPNIFSPGERIFTVLLRGYAKAGMGGEAELLLKKMQDYHNDGKLDFSPNNIHYGCVINALSQCSSWDAPERGEALMKQMREDPKLKPSLMTYNYLLRTYSKEGMASKAEVLLSEMYELHRLDKLDDRPDCTSYRYCMLALAKNGGHDIDYRAKLLLEKMKVNHEAGDSCLIPDDSIKRNFLFCFEKRGKLQEGINVLASLQ